MNLNVYSVYDKVAQAFVTPFFMHNDGIAIRAFSDNVNSNEDSTIVKHYEQYALYRLGTFNDKKDISKQ